jgi:hypothetical protein
VHQPWPHVLRWCLDGDRSGGNVVGVGYHPVARQRPGRFLGCRPQRSAGRTSFAYAKRPAPVAATLRRSRPCGS